MSQVRDDSLKWIESKLDVLTDSFVMLRSDVDGLKTDFDRLETNLNLFDTKFTNHQQATRWVVQLAFTLIVSATFAVIISTVV